MASSSLFVCWPGRVKPGISPRKKNDIIRMSLVRYGIWWMIFWEFLEIAINQWHWYFLWNAMNSWLEWIFFGNSWGYHWHILVDWLWVTGVFYYLDYWGLWVGLMENLQETMVLTMKNMGFSCKNSPKPIHWYWGLWANRH